MSLCRWKKNKAVEGERARERDREDENGSHKLMIRQIYVAMKKKPQKIDIHSKLFAHFSFQPFMFCFFAFHS